MNIAEIKKRLRYIVVNNLFDSHYINDMKWLIERLEQADDALKLYTDWQTYNKLSLGKGIPIESDKGNIAKLALKAIQGDET